MRGPWLPLAVDPECEGYLRGRVAALHEELQRVDQLVAANDLPDAILTDSGLKITPLDATVPHALLATAEQICLHPVKASKSRQPTLSLPGTR